MLRTRGVIAVAAAAAAVVTASASAAPSAGAVRFGFVPQRAFQGQASAVSVLVRPANARCTLAVRYVDGSLQQGLGAVRAKAGRASWKWSLALAAPVGLAHASVRCGRSGSVARSFLVVGGTALPSKLQITAQGFSQRPNSYGSGSTVSYGIVLDNPNTARDAQKVSVLVNFLDAAGHVMQTATSRVDAVGADSTWNVGGAAQLPSQTPVARLEIVVQTAAFVAHALVQPALENVNVYPSAFEPAWVGGVSGDLINVQPVDILSGAQLSIVLYNSAGQVIGGGTGFFLASLLPGTRAFFNASAGFSPVPFAQASTAAISISPTYKAPGT